MIPEAKREDTGQYTVLARNEVGTRSCSMCRLRVLSEHERPSVGAPTEFAPVVLEALREAPLTARSGLLRPHPLQHQLQLQQSAASGATRLAGDCVLLTCAALANPPPSALWLFRTRPLRFSERVLAEFRPPSWFYLRILEPTAADSGLYSLMLSNKLGDFITYILIDCCTRTFEWYILCITYFIS